MSIKKVLGFLTAYMLVSGAHATPYFLLEGSGQGFSRIETSTGVETFIGNTGVARLQGLDARPGDNKLFAIETFGSNGLYTIDQNTGLATLVGNTNIGSGPESLAFDSAGTMYVSSTGGPVLFTVDSNTAATNTLGAISGMNDVDGLTFSRVPVAVQGQGVVAADTLFAIDSGSLYTIDINTLVATLIGSISASETIAFDAFGVLHGVDGANNVFRYDLSNLSSTLIGSSSMSTVWGSAFLLVPEPATLALFGLALAGLGFAGRRVD